MKDLRVPEELRGLFKKPFGELYSGQGLKPAQDIKAVLKDERIIVVGDVTLRNVLAIGLKPSLAIVDLKTKRDREMLLGGKAIKVRNSPGMITQELWNSIHENIDKEDVTILVDGEEDLAVLPCILEAEWDAIILYGQPNEGIVLVKVDEDKKLKASMLLKMLSSVSG
ncbi:MAG: DUF359 domain-containing protein [Candidatus Hydrothermarchaeales archaeon]